MRRLTLFLVIICIFSIPSLAQDSTDCIAHSEEATLELPDEWFTWENWYEYLNEGVLTYLNMAGNTDSLATSIENEETELITADTYSADVDNNGLDDFLLMTLLNFGGGYSYQMAVYTCDEGTYRLLDDFIFGESGMGATLELIADTNGNNIPEIIMRPTYIPRKYYESLNFYEWNGTEVVLIFQTGWEYGGYGDVYLTNFNNDPTEMEILVERLYSYGEATAEAYIELWLRRPVNMVFTWTGETYELFCEYLRIHRRYSIRHYIVRKRIVSVGSMRMRWLRTSVS